METGAGRNAEWAGTAEQRGGIDAMPVPEAVEARYGVNRFDESAVGEMPPVIEVSDRDYRSFCFPCHALEEAGNCNDAV
jgi:hypothetical protein